MHEQSTCAKGAHVYTWVASMPVDAFNMWHLAFNMRDDAVGPCVLAGSPGERAPQFTCVCVPPVLLLGVHHFRPRTVTTLLAAMRHCVNYTRCLRDLANGRQSA